MDLCEFLFQVVLITSSIVTLVAYVIFGVYCMFYSHTPGMDWFPPLCLAIITFSGCMGVLPIPFILSIEIFPGKVSDRVNDPTDSIVSKTIPTFLTFISFADPFNVSSGRYCNDVGVSVCARITISNRTSTIWTSHMFLHFRWLHIYSHLVCILFHTRNTWQIIRRDYKDITHVDCMIVRVHEQMSVVFLFFCEFTGE